MKLSELVGWSGLVTIKVLDLQGEVIDETIVKNLITTVGKEMLRDILSGAITDGEIKYVGMGSDNTAPAVGQTTLVAEEFRKAMTTQANGGGTAELDSTVYIAPFEANTFTTEEIGWFAGVAAGAGADSGIMVARILYSRAKNNLEAIQIVRTDTISEV